MYAACTCRLSRTACAPALAAVSTRKPAGRGRRRRHPWSSAPPVARRAPGKQEFVFPADGARGHIEEPKFPLALVQQASGVRISAGDLRRTYVTAAASADISPLALKALVNHSLGGDVTSGYVVMTTADLLPAAQRVADRIKERCGIEAPGGNVSRLR